MNNPSKGYYSIVQYCPDLSRQESANVGVILFCPEKFFLAAQMSRGQDRVRRFFGSDSPDFSHLEALKASVAERINNDHKNLKKREDLEAFIATRGNEMILTPLRTMKVFDPKQDLNKLFDRLVGGRGGNVPRPSVRRSLKKLFETSNVSDKIAVDVTVDVPVINRPLRVPYGYQNGRFNLIQPLRFSGLAEESAIGKACKFAVEGESIHKHAHPKLGELQLVVVGHFAEHQRDERRMVRSILEENSVELYTMNQASKLIEDIRKNGKVIDLPKLADQQPERDM